MKAFNSMGCQLIACWESALVASWSITALKIKWGPFALVVIYQLICQINHKWLALKLYKKNFAFYFVGLIFTISYWKYYSKVPFPIFLNILLWQFRFLCKFIEKFCNCSFTMDCITWEEEDSNGLVFHFVWLCKTYFGMW